MLRAQGAGGIGADVFAHGAGGIGADVFTDQGAGGIGAEVFASAFKPAALVNTSRTKATTTSHLFTVPLRVGKALRGGVYRRSSAVKRDISGCVSKRYTPLPPGCARTSPNCRDEISVLKRIASMLRKYYCPAAAQGERQLLFLERILRCLAMLSCLDTLRTHP